MSPSHDAVVLPATERLLLGPGPSAISPRVMRALAAPMLSHLDPDFVGIMDDTSRRLARVARAPEGTLAVAVSGTGSAAIETMVANLVQPGVKVVSVVTGYFGARLADLCERYGADVTRVDAEWGRACDPEAVGAALASSGAAIVTIVHAETSTGVLNPVQAVAEAARAHDALVLVDAVTSLGGMPLDMAAWGLDAIASCSQKCLGAPSGVAPLLFGPRALERRVPCRSFYLDIGLIEDYWRRRKYHHTMCASLIYALDEALAAVEDEGLEARWARHERHHTAFVAGLESAGLGVLPPPGERLWTLHTVRVPDGIDEAAVRRHLLEAFNIEIGAGLGPLAGAIWRIGLMGASSTAANVLLALAALDSAITEQRRGQLVQA